MDLLWQGGKETDAMGFFKKEALFAARQQSTKRSKERTVLLVDDEEHNLRTLADLLGEYYHVLTASNGEEALRLLQTDSESERIQLIVSDQRMPSMTGVDFFQRTLSLLPQAKRILLTGYTDVEVIIDSINKAQIYKFILKPYDQRQLLFTIQRALELFDLEEKNRSLVNELRQLNSHLEEKVELRTQELETALQKLHQLNESKDRFLSILAHDLRMPSQALLLLAEALFSQLAELEKDFKGSSTVHLIYTATLDLSQLLEDLLSWSSLQRKQRFRTCPESQSLRAMVEQVCSFLNERANEKGIQLINEIQEENDPVVFADPNIVRTVLRNLMTNAIKFSEGGVGAWVRVFCREIDEATLFVCVEDEGVGMLPEKRESILARTAVFQDITFRAKRERGTGLGLILCQELVESYGGTFLVESEPGQGSTFSFSLTKETGSRTQEHPQA